MIRLNRTTEYGLLALQHMSRKQAADAASVTSAREVADSYGLPFEILAKTLQRLKDTGIILSAQGARGGYTLQRALTDITLAEFLQMMEGPQSVVACATAPKEGASPCEFNPKCGIHGPMQVLNSRVVEFLSNIRLAEITGKVPAAGVRAS